MRAQKIAGLLARYGILWNQSADTIVRTGNGVGRTVASFNNLRPWSLIRRCNLADDGTVLAYWGNTAFKYDGSNGQVMVEFPKFYYRFPHTATVHAPEISFHNRCGFKPHPWFIDGEGNELQHQYVGVFESSAYDTSGSAYLLDDDAGVDFTATTGDLLCSIAGVLPMSGANNATATRDNFRQLALNRGAGWDLWSVQAVSAIQMLYTIKYGNLNSQTALSDGVTNLASGIGNQAVRTGATAGIGPTGSTDLGNTDGQVSIAHWSQGTTTYPFNLFGVENFYGDQWSWVMGADIVTDNKLSIDGTATGITLPNTNGYGGNLAYNAAYDWLMMPSDVTGSQSAKLCDYYYQATGNRAALLGGRWSSGAAAGAFCWALDRAASTVDRTVGGRLRFTPQS
jgi:hypothetical protein